MATYTKKASGYTGIGNVEIIRETDKSWQVQMADGQQPFVPKSQFRCVDGIKTPLKVGEKRTLEVKAWLVEKWGKVSSGPAPTFEFDLDVGIEEVVQAVMPNAKTTPDDSFLYDYSKKQLIAACTAYRSVIQQMAAAAESYHPELVTRLARDGKTLDGRACSPDPKGMFPMVTQCWDNQGELREIGKKGDAILRSMYIGQAMLEKMGAIETLLLEKRAEVAGELIASMDEDEE